MFKRVVFCGSIVIVVMFVPVRAISNSEVVKKEINLDRVVEYVAKKYNVDDKLIKAIVYVESGNGRFLIGDRNRQWKYQSYGVMQVKLSTARFVAGYFKLNWVNDLSDEQLKDRLLNDNLFNVTIGTLYLKYLMKATGGDVVKAVRAYNRGLKGKSDNSKYVNKVMKVYNEMR